MSCLFYLICLQDPVFDSAPPREPPNMNEILQERSFIVNQVLFIQTGTGIDVHGQNITKAAVRAVENAIWFNSMPGIEKSLPEQQLENMKVQVKLAVPLEREQLDTESVKKAIPYGSVSVDVTDGGMATSSGITLKDKGDENDLMYIVNAAVEVGY